jgi:hypothetical protein
MMERPTSARNRHNARCPLNAGSLIVAAALGCGGDDTGTIDTGWIEYPAAERVE